MSSPNGHRIATPPIATAHLFPELNRKLIALLRSLSPEQWRMAALPRWTVKDIAAHLLDSTLRRLSMGRDGYWGEEFHGSTPEEFKAFLNNLNEDWVRANRRVSPRVLCDLLESSGEELAEYFQTLDPFGEALFAVSWAGETTSQSWFDIAREYTEKWHHQQQIRDAVGAESLLTRELYKPVIDTFMRALPHTYSELDAPPGTAIHFVVDGDSGGSWLLKRDEQRWRLEAEVREDASATVVIPGNIAWKLFTKGLSGEAARTQLKVEGDKALAEPCFRATAIVG